MCLLYIFTIGAVFFFFVSCSRVTAVTLGSLLGNTELGKTLTSFQTAAKTKKQQHDSLIIKWNCSPTKFNFLRSNLFLLMFLLVRHLGRFWRLTASLTKGGKSPSICGGYMFHRAGLASTDGGQTICLLTQNTHWYYCKGLKYLL